MPETRRISAVTVMGWIAVSMVSMDANASFRQKCVRTTIRQTVARILGFDTPENRYLNYRISDGQPPRFKDGRPTLALVIDQAARLLSDPRFEQELDTLYRSPARGFGQAPEHIAHYDRNYKNSVYVRAVMDQHGTLLGFGPLEEVLTKAQRESDGQFTELGLILNRGSRQNGRREIEFHAWSDLNDRQVASLLALDANINRPVVNNNGYYDHTGTRVGPKPYDPSRRRQAQMISDRRPLRLRPPKGPDGQSRQVMNSRQRSLFRVEFQSPSRTFTNRSGRPLDSTGDRIPPIDFDMGHFVLNQKGEFYFAYGGRTQEFHPYHLAGSEPLIGAGRAEFKDGVLKSLSNKIDGATIEPATLIHVLEKLKAQGMPASQIANIELQFHVPYTGKVDVRISPDIWKALKNYGIYRVFIFDKDGVAHSRHGIPLSP